MTREDLIQTYLELLHKRLNSPEEEYFRTLIGGILYYKNGRFMVSWDYDSKYCKFKWFKWGYWSFAISLYQNMMLSPDCTIETLQADILRLL